MPFKQANLNKNIIKHIQRSKYSEKALIDLKEEEILEVLGYLYEFKKWIFDPFKEPFLLVKKENGK